MQIFWKHVGCIITFCDIDIELLPESPISIEAPLL